MPKKRKRLPPKMCPAHNVKLAYAPNRWGSCWRCPVDGCTVRCWGGDTSSPCDDALAAERRATHAAFDPLWQHGTRFQSRNAAYKWLREAMGLSGAQCHIGLFDADQCRRVRELIDEELMPAGA